VEAVAADLLFLQLSADFSWDTDPKPTYNNKLSAHAIVMRDPERRILLQE